MRGAVLSFDPAAGAGWISGEDGFRYAFTTADLAAPVPVHPGALLDFTPVGNAATQVTAAPGQFLPAPSGGMFSAVTPDPVGEPDLSVWGYAKRCLQKYADFNGRARRKEYWSFVLVEMLVFVPLYFIMVVIFGVIGAYAPPEGAAASTPTSPALIAAGSVAAVLGLVVFVLAMARVIPSYAVLARRFHDVGLSAWWMLIAFIPFAGLLLYVVLFLPSQPGRNIYGGYPKPVT